MPDPRAGLTACRQAIHIHQQREKERAMQEKSQEPITPEGFTEVLSTNVHAYYFLDQGDKRGELQVVFKSGHRYHYRAVESHLVAALREADSFGRFINAYIKPNHNCYQAHPTTGEPLMKEG